MKLFEEINVWERNQLGQAICYRCFRIIPDGGYCVQSADYYYASDLAQSNLDRQHIELFIEESPDVRFRVYATIEKAIENFKTEFTASL